MMADFMEFCYYPTRLKTVIQSFVLGHKTFSISNSERKNWQIRGNELLFLISVMLLGCLTWIYWFVFESALCHINLREISVRSCPRRPLLPSSAKRSKSQGVICQRFQQNGPFMNWHCMVSSSDIHGIFKQRCILWLTSADRSKDILSLLTYFSYLNFKKNHLQGESYLFYLKNSVYMHHCSEQFLPPYV